MRTTIFIAAPPGGTWPLAMGGFEVELRSRWPEVWTARRTSAITSEEYLAFEIDIEGESRHGAYFDHRSLHLQDGTPEFWADTIVWFLSLLHRDAGVVCMTEHAPEPTSLARDATADQIVAVLDALND